jgi:tetratricopeptide (TPR) repeat protein
MRLRRLLQAAASSTSDGALSQQLDWMVDALGVPQAEATAIEAELTRSAATILNDMGQSSDALRAAEQAVAHYDALARQGQAVPILEWAGALNTLARALGALGRYADALETTEHGIALLRTKLDTQGEEAKYALALFLSNSALYRNAVDPSAETVTACEEAVALHKEIAPGNPHYPLHDLAGALFNLTASLDRTGRFSKALDASEEALQILSSLYEKDSDTFTLDYCLAVAQKGTLLQRFERHAEAADCYLIAASALGARLSELSPEDRSKFSEIAYDFRVSAEHAGLTKAEADARLFAATGLKVSLTGEDGKESIEDLQHLTSHMRTEWQGNPYRLAAIAPMLMNLASALIGEDRHDEALAAAIEAEAHYALLSERHGRGPSHQHLRAIYMQASCLFFLGRNAEAPACAERGLRAVASAKSVDYAAVGEMYCTLESAYIDSSVDLGKHPLQCLQEVADICGGDPPAYQVFNAFIAANDAGDFDHAQAIFSVLKGALDKILTEADAHLVRKRLDEMRRDLGPAWRYTT